MSGRLTTSLYLILKTVEDPRPDAPIGNCPVCKSELLTGRYRRTGLFFCLHPASTYKIPCRFSFARIAAEKELSAMRAKAQEWIEDHPF
jgi:hypothetical protein